MTRNNPVRKYLSVFLLSFLVSVSVFADTVYLKNGGRVDGKIAAQNDDYLKLEVEGVTLTYWRDEISRIVKEARSSFAASPKTTEKKHFLWEARCGSSTVYLLGSIHLGRPDFYPLDKVIEEAFSRCDVLAVEANIDSLDISALQPVIENAVYMDGSTLKDHLSPEVFELASQRMRGLGMDIESLATFKPWFLAVNLEVLGYLQLGFDPSYGIDFYFLNKAKDSKEIVELESIEFQLNLLSGFTEKEQEALLLSTLMDISTARAKAERMVHLWKHGDAAAMNALFIEGIRSDPDLFSVYNKLLFQRNKGMVSKIKQFLESSGEYFVVVGAGHLIGKRGIVQILKNEGYAVRQL